MALVKRYFNPPDSSYFLFGPRGSGKSTWLRQREPRALWIDLLDADVFREYVAYPERLTQTVAQAPAPKVIVIDEVQKAPALLDVVHKLIEEHRRKPLQFILTGSSARKLKRAGVDLLAGRAILKTLHPFMAAKLGEAFNLDSALQIGMLPLVVFAKDPRETLKSYVALYLREEVQSEGIIRNVGSFGRFIEAISLSHGNQLNTAEVARDCQVARRTVDGYVQILEDLLLAFRIPIFARKAKRALVQHAKFYFADTGIFRAVRPTGPLDSPELVGGTSLEGLVAQHLRAWIAYGKEDCTLHFWRTRAGLEVDFVLYGPQTFAAIEVKAAKSVWPRDLRSLKEFIADYPQARPLLLYGGQDRLSIDGIPCIPVDQFLRDLKPGAWPHGQRAS